MKTIKKQTILTLWVMLAITIGCTNKSDDSVSPDNTSGTITQGTWKVEYFNDSGKDETYKFNGYTFTFGSNGTITATNGSLTETGHEDGNDDSQVKLYLTFTGTFPFDKIRIIGM